MEWRCSAPESSATLNTMGVRDITWRERADQPNVNFVIEMFHSNNVTCQNVSFRISEPP